VWGYWRPTFLLEVLYLGFGAGGYAGTTYGES
jgi:hypothetical protein